VTDAAVDTAKYEVAQRMSAAFASMADGRADAKEVRESLRA
jgi:acetyl esterase